MKIHLIKQDKDVSKVNSYAQASYKRLQKEWYLKLKTNGFVDIEDTESPREFLKVWEDSYFRAKYTCDVFLAKREYFSSASQFLETHPFSTNKEKKLWLMHSEGKSIREIAKTLKLSLWKSHDMIKQLRNLMLEQR